MDNRIKLSTEFKTDTPVLPDVKIIDIWAEYDGPLFGICKVHGQEFFFIDAIYDIWRYYDDDTCQRLWCIYSVYDISLKKAEKIIEDRPRIAWQADIKEESECIGIFWEYDNLTKDMG